MEAGYRYQTKVRPIDFWILLMYRTYHSLAGVCNIVFGGSMILLTLRFWSESDIFVQALLILACLLIPVIQPFGIYLRARKQVSMISQKTELIFMEDGIHAALGEKRELIPWKKVKGVKKEAGMILVFVDANHAYMLTDSVLGSQNTEFYEYVKSHI